MKSFFCFFTQQNFKHFCSFAFGTFYRYSTLRPTPYEAYAYRCLTYLLSWFLIYFVSVMERLPTSISEIQAFLNNYDITVSNTPTNSLHAYETMQALLSCNESRPFDRLHRISSQFGYFCSQQSLHSQPFPYLKYATSTCEYFLPLWDKSQAKMSFLPVLFSKVSALSCNLVIMLEGEHTWGTSCDEDITLSLALESEEALGGCVLTWMRLESGQRVALLRVDGWHATIPPNDTEWSHFTTLYHKYST